MYEEPLKVFFRKSLIWYNGISFHSPDEGLTLEMSALQIFHGGNSTFNNSFDKAKFL